MVSFVFCPFSFEHQKKKKRSIEWRILSLIFFWLVFFLFFRITVLFGRNCDIREDFSV